MFIRVHRPSQLRGGRANLMLLNTDNIASVIDRGTHLEILDTADRSYEITETLIEFYDMVHPDEPQNKPAIFKEGK